MSEPGLGRAVLELSTDDTKLFGGLDKAKAGTKGLESNFKSAGESAKAFGSALSSVFGEDLERRAKASATGILQVGGAMKLTDGEVKANLATLNAWIEKAGRLGKEVPAHMLSTRDALKQVEAATALAAQKATALHEAMQQRLVPTLTMAQKAAGLLSSAFAQFTLAGLATQAIGKLGTEVSALIAVGMKLPAVEQSYGRLTAAMRVDGQTMLTNMAASTRGLVANYDLMASANKAMLLGLPVTAASMGDLAKTATILGKAMGQDATKSLDDLITALGRSSPMILDNLGLTVKVGEANDAYAAKLGKTADQLNDAEKKMAFYEAAMVAAQKKTAELGEQTMTLGEIVTSVWTQIGNGVTSAAATINVGIGSAASSVKGFAAFLSDVVKHGAGGAVALAALREQMIAMAAARAAMMGKDVNLTSPESALLKLQAEATKAVAAVVPLTGAQRDLAIAFDKSGLSVQQITEKMAPLHVSMKAVQNAIDASKKSTTEAATAAKRYADLVAEVTQANQALTIEQIATVRSLDALGVGHGKIADYLKVTEAQVSKFTDSLKEQAKAIAAIGKAIDAIPHNARLRLQTDNLSGIVPMIDVKALKTYSEGMGAIKQIHTATFDEIESRMRVMGVNTRAELVRLAGVAREQFDSMKASGQFTTAELAAAWERYHAAADKAAGKTHDVGKALGELTQAFAQLAQVSSGSLGSVIRDLGTFVAALETATKSMKSFRAGRKAWSSDDGDEDTHASFGDKLSGIAGMATGLIGITSAAIAAGKAIASLFHHNTQGRDLVVDWVTKEFGSFDALQKKMLELGPDYDRLWRALTQGDRSDPKAAQAAIDAVTAALGALKTKTAEAAQAAVDASAVQQEALDGITAKYADTIAKIDSEYKSLSDAVAGEAEEEVMGVVEMQQRARMQQLDEQKKAAEAQRDAEIAAKKETFTSVLDVAQHLDDELRELFRNPLEIPIKFIPPQDWNYNLPSGSPSAPPVGGYAIASPALFLPGGAGASSSFAGATRQHEQSIVVKLNDRELIRAVARGLPRELVISGVGGR